MSIRPDYLKAGDRVGILSTARKITETELLPLVQDLRAWGLELVFGKTIGAVSDQFAGDDNCRQNDLQAFLNDPSIKAVICARGGYGTIRIVDGIDWRPLFQQPKWICGFSDITVLHAHLNNLGMPTIHSAMGSTWTESTAAAKESLRDALFGKALRYEGKHQALFLREGITKGILVGGNSSILYALQGSVSDLETEDKILFVEDLDEYLYHMDRQFYSLSRAGKLEDIKGLIVGGMTQMKDNDIPFGEDMYQIISKQVKEQSYPYCFDFPCGHIADNRALRLGMEATLQVSATGYSFVQEA